VTPDHYAALGLSPTSEDVVIRAAYKALMRRYHPDGNPSAEAAARTRAINAAYAVLSNPGRRAEYDSIRAEEGWRGELAPHPPQAIPGLFPAAATLLVLLVLLLVVWSPLPMFEPPDRLAPAQGRKVAAADPPLLPEVTRPANQPTAPPAPAEDPVPNVQLDRPPPVIAPPPAEPPPTPRLRPTPRPQLAVATPKPAPVPQVAMAKSKPAAAPQAAPQPAAAEARPSFSCRVASTRGEIAVCNSANLAILDRQQALLYSQSLGRADAAKRARLVSTGERFLARRDGCRSVECTSAAYLARMREVSEIMSGQAKPDTIEP
jgi:hypothetical protein